MALFYVTGLSGTGKPAVRGELQARGYYARGVDEDGYEAAYRGYGAVIIDAARPLGDVVDEILATSLSC